MPGSAGSVCSTVARDFPTRHPRGATGADGAPCNCREQLETLGAFRCDAQRRTLLEVSDELVVEQPHHPVVVIRKAKDAVRHAAELDHPDGYRRALPVDRARERLVICARGRATEPSLKHDSSLARNVPRSRASAAAAFSHPMRLCYVASVDKRARPPHHLTLADCRPSGAFRSPFNEADSRVARSERAYRMRAWISRRGRNSGQCTNRPRATRRRSARATGNLPNGCFGV